MKQSLNEFNRWLDREVEWLDSAETKFSKVIEECECTLSALKDNEQQVEMLRSQQEELLRELRSLTHKEHQLVQTRTQLDTDIKNSKSTRSDMNELARGLRLYRYLGLEFQKADADCMKFTFTQIDPNDPTRQFYFLLHVNDSDQYMLVDTKPTLPKDFCVSQIRQLNADNNIGRFVSAMRKRFQEYVH